MTARVVVVGSANLDLVVTAPALPRPGETVLGGEFTTVPGGKGANQAVAAARAGGRVSFVGAVGDDDFARPQRDNLVAADVDVSRLRTVPGPSGVALIAVDQHAENLIVVAPGANAALAGLSPEDRAEVARADVLLCQLEIPVETVAEAAATARANGTVVVLNAAPARTLPAAVLSTVDLLVVNEGEAEVLAGRPAEPGDLLDLVPRVVMTLGARGAAYADRDGLRLDVAAPAVTAVDTTAAGDAFTGALAVAWAEGRPVEEAVRWACAAGAVCATRPGASSSLPTRAEIEALS
ncbi:ribokinase [Phytohabitans houttuyneae]|uniref:Ribokinase n=2 Tax=Phytohabitans houttuyneae TaxID=1076126 RepID=A0A6V8K836_9ACTN|nr:ribokinase [Phytohabitans houttuyneae]